MTIDAECIIIGAGFTGLRALIEARRRGISAKLIEAGSDVGGTWYWNRYPGARSDSDAWTYCYSFDPDLLQEWDWVERYPAQQQIQGYLGFVADRYDLRRDIVLGTRVTSLVRDDEANCWTIGTDGGRAFTATYVIPAVGPLSEPLAPSFPGLATFRGEYYSTSRWPKERVRFHGKRVGIIGTGSSGVQVVPPVAEAALHLTVFQRTANYVLPARNRPIDELHMQAIKDNYASIWEDVERNPVGFATKRSQTPMAEFDETERLNILERYWDFGGFAFTHETFSDMMLDDAANAFVSEFLRGKIRSIVRDPVTAELLCPSDHGLGAKRPPCGSDYYQAFNKPNVSLVSVRDNPIVEITERGIVLADGSEHELDIIIFAVGFDAFTGALTAMDVRGSDGRSLEECWREGASSYLSFAVPRFPNLFIAAGPHLPIGNFPPIGEKCVKWIFDAIEHMRGADILAMEARQDGVERWMNVVNTAIKKGMTRFGESVGAWYVGGNVPGKAHAPLYFAGPVQTWEVYLNESVAAGYADFHLTRAKG